MLCESVRGEPSRPIVPGRAQEVRHRYLERSGVVAAGAVHRWPSAAKDRSVRVSGSRKRRRDQNMKLFE
jgi:hypothetical protein